MKFHRHLYIDETVKNPHKLRRKLRRRLRRKLRPGLWMNVWPPGVYVIALGQGSSQLEFYNAAFLRQKHLRRVMRPYIIGLAANREEAETVVVRIIDECYQQTGTAAIKEWLLG